MTIWSIESSHLPCNLVFCSTFSLITATASSTRMLVKRDVSHHKTPVSLVEALPGQDVAEIFGVSYFGSEKVYSIFII